MIQGGSHRPWRVPLRRPGDLRRPGHGSGRHLHAAPSSGIATPESDPDWPATGKPDLQRPFDRMRTSARCRTEGQYWCSEANVSVWRGGCEGMFAVVAANSGRPRRAGSVSRPTRSPPGQRRAVVASRPVEQGFRAGPGCRQGVGTARTEGQEVSRATRLASGLYSRRSFRFWMVTGLVGADHGGAARASTAEACG